MVHHTVTDRTLALAGVFQAAGQIQILATHGSVNPLALEVCIQTLFEFNPITTEAIYGGITGLRSGLEWLVEHLSGKHSLPMTQIIKYVVGVLYLERQLAKRPIMLERISEDVERARLQSGHFSSIHSNVLASLAGCYSETISTLNPRIIVKGEEGFLSNPKVANTVRSLLLAAIRSAVLWRQCGGNRIHLLFGRRKLLNEAQRLLKRV